MQQTSSRRTTESEREIFIWGAGSAGRAAAAVLRTYGITLSGFIDRDPVKKGTKLEGVRIFVPDELSKRPAKPKVLIASMYYREIAKQLRTMGFRARRDFEVFPASGTDLPNKWPTPRFFVAWRKRWFKFRMCVRAGSSGTPMIHLVKVGVNDHKRISCARLLRLLPKSDSAWICVHSSIARVMRCYWQIPPKSTDLAAKVTVDPVPPSGLKNSRPFLIRFLGLCTIVPAPVICRVRVVRKLLTAKPDGISLNELTAWLKTHDISSRGSVLCEIQLPTMARAMQHTGRYATDRKEVSPTLRNFVEEIAKSGLPVFSADEVAQDLPRLAELMDSKSNFNCSTGRDSSARKMRIQVVSHERGNFFFTEIRDFLAGSWRRAGAEVIIGNQRSPRLRAPWRNVIVAPHEFDLLGDVNNSWSSTNNVVAFNTEQPHTHWFSTGLPRILRSKLVFDINWQSSLLLRALGVNAYFFPLGIDDQSPMTRPRRIMRKRPAFMGMRPSELRLPDKDSWQKRPIDILFVGTLSEKRARFFAVNAATFSCFRCFFHLPPSNQPLTLETPDSFDSQDMADLCRRSKIILNIHRDTVPYCEWHRVVFQAMRQGALIISEPMMEVPGFSAGEHFITAPVEELASVAVQMLSTAQGRHKAAKIALHAFQTMRTSFDAVEIANNSLTLL